MSGWVGVRCQQGRTVLRCHGVRSFVGGVGFPYGKQHLSEHFNNSCWLFIKRANNKFIPSTTIIIIKTTTLAGPDTAMEDEETNIFSGVVFETIEAVALGLGIGLGQVGVEGQSVVGRRELKKRIKRGNCWVMNGI